MEEPFCKEMESLIFIITKLQYVIYLSMFTQNINLISTANFVV